MIASERLRHFPFFAGLNHDQLMNIAKMANEKTVEEGHYFFHEGDDVQEFYIVVDGAVGIVIEIPDQDFEQPIAGQLTGKINTKDITVSTIGSGMVFGWPGIIPPSNANATAKALTRCRLYAFDCIQLKKAFEIDCDLAYKMTLKAAQVMRERLRDLQIESLTFLSS